MLVASFVVHDCQQFRQHPVLHNLLQGDKLRANHRPCLLMSLFSLFASLCFYARTPGHHIEEEGARSNRLIKHLEHPVADIKGLEPPQEVKLAQALHVDCRRV